MRRNAGLARTGAASLLAAAMLLAACETAPVTGRKQLIVLPESQAIELGEQAYQQILSESTTIRSGPYARRVETIGRRIVAVSGQPDLPWEFTVIDDATPNAFALPGGKVGVHSGMVQLVDNDDQLAAVMAHEVAHAVARHSAERMSQQLLVEGGLQGLGMVTNNADYVRLAASAAQLGIVLPYSREQESEADRIGLMYMARAGYDPRAAVELWQIMQRAGGGAPPEFLSTHPSSGTRIERLQEWMPEALAVYRDANPGQ
jgi:metalloendopeptidase OMA1, mitochondrial